MSGADNIRSVEILVEKIRAETVHWQERLEDLRQRNRGQQVGLMEWHRIAAVFESLELAGVRNPGLEARVIEQWGNQRTDWTVAEAVRGLGEACAERTRIMARVLAYEALRASPDDVIAQQICGLWETVQRHCSMTIELCGGQPLTWRELEPLLEKLWNRWKDSARTASKVPRTSNSRQSVRPS